MQWWFKKFCKEDKNFEDEERSGWPLKVGSEQLRVIIEAGPLTATQEIAKELNIDQSKVIVEANPFEANWTVIFLFSVQLQWTIFQWDCDM